MSEKKMITYEGFKNLEDELYELKNVRRPATSQRIKEARAQGDLSENAEYDAAREEQRKEEARILEITEILKNSIVVKSENNGNGSDKVVAFGSTVTFEDMGNHQKYTYRIVGTKEANLQKGTLSNESPIGVAMLGARIEQVVSIETPAGTKSYMVLGIEN